MRMLVLFVSALAAIPASASGDTIAVVAVAAPGGVSSAELDELAGAIAAELRTRGHEVLPPSDASAGIERNSPGCMAAPSTACIADGLRRMRWPRFVQVQLSRRQNGQVSISLEVYETTAEHRLGAAERTGPANGPAQRMAIARESVAAILESISADSRAPIVPAVPGSTDAPARLSTGRAAMPESDGDSRAARPIVGPLLLGIAGIALLAVDVVALATARCEQEAPDGTCLRGETPSFVPLILVGTAGALSVGAAFTWFLLGSSAE